MTAQACGTEGAHAAIAEPPYPTISGLCMAGVGLQLRTWGGIPTEWLFSELCI